MKKRKHSLPPHIVLPNGQWRFVKRGSKRVSTLKKYKRKRVFMAKRYRAKRGGSRGGMGSLKTMIAPVLGGVADSYLDPMLPIDGLGGAAVGLFLKSPTVRDIGLYKVGFSLGNILPLPRIGGVSGSGFS